MSRASHRILISFLSNALSPIAGLATAPLLARGLGADGRGEVAAALAPLILGATIATVGLPPAATYLVARTPGLAKFVAARAGALLIVTGLITTALIAWASPWLAQGDADLKMLVVIAGVLTVPTMLVVLMQGVASGLHAWNRVLVERTISAGGRIIGITTLFVSDQLTSMSAVLVLGLVPLLGGFAYIGMWRSTNERGPIPSMPSLVHLGGRLWLGTLSGVLLARADQALMAPLSSTRQLGYYAVAVSISELALVANNSIREVMFPDLASRFSADRLVTASRLSTLVATVLAALIAVGTVLFLPTIFGEEFRAAVPVTLILILAVLAGNPGSMAGVGLNATGRPGRRSTSLAVACVVNIALVIVLVPALGATGAAIATLVGNIVSSNLNIMFVWRLEGISPLEFYRVRSDDVSSLRRLGRDFVHRNR